MNKERYLFELKKALRGMDHHEIDDILSDYEEHFRIASLDGKTEQDIAAALGHPKTLGKSFRIESKLYNKGKKPGIKEILSVFLISLSLGFFNILFALGPFFAFLAILITLWTAAAGLSLSGVSLGVYALIYRYIPGAPGLSGLNVPFLVFAGIGATALGLLMIIGMFFFTKLVLKGFIKYLQLNSRLIIRRKESNREEV